MNQWLLLGLCLFLLTPDQPPNISSMFSHGTVVFTLAAKDGFVMAADGLTISQGGADAKPLEGSRSAAEHKVVVCGNRFLCGMAGINPIHDTIPGAKVEYDFHNWISSIGSNQKTSPLQFAKAMEAKARTTFGGMDVIMRVDPFWKSKAAPHEFVAYQVDGYDAGVPQICEVLIDADIQNHRLNYHAPSCMTPEWKSPSPTDFISVPLALGRTVKSIMQSSGPEQSRFREIQPKAISIAVTLLPNAPRALQKVAGNAAAFIQVTDEFNPKAAGGVTTIGILQKGKPPFVLQYPHL